MRVSVPILLAQAALAIGQAAGDVSEQLSQHRDFAMWKAIDRPWRTIPAPIFTSLPPSMVTDHRSTSASHNKIFALHRW